MLQYELDFSLQSATENRTITLLQFTPHIDDIDWWQFSCLSIRLERAIFSTIHPDGSTYARQLCLDCFFMGQNTVREAEGLPVTASCPESGGDIWSG